MEIHLTQQKCVACEGGMPPLTRDEAAILLRQVPQWQISDDGKWISRSYDFTDFKEALAFIDRVGALAESEGHHPDLHLTGFRHVRVELSTHAIGGLSQNDFILAAKIDA